MSTRSLLVKSFVVSATLLAAAGAHAQYRCDAPATPVDRGACAAAKEGPEALRRYIQRVQALESLQFSDYVNDATQIAWDARQRRQELARSSAKEVASKRP